MRKLYQLSYVYNRKHNSNEPWLTKLKPTCCTSRVCLPNTDHVTALWRQRRKRFIAKSFWNKFTKWYNDTCGRNIALEQNEIIYGVLRYTSSFFNSESLDHNWEIILCTNGVHDEKRPQFTDFVTLVNETIELEKYISITTNKILSFTEKWSKFLNN